MCVCVSERVRVYVCVVFVRERECACVCVRDGERGEVMKIKKLRRIIFRALSCGLLQFEFCR